MQTASSLAVDAVWELGLFGANRRGREAAVARVQARAADWHDARVSLAAEVADNYMNLRACEALVAGYRQDLTSRQDSARLTQLKADNGFSNRADAALGNASAAEAETRLTAQQAECDLSIKALAALTGQAKPALRSQLASHTGQLPRLPTSGVTSVPAQLLNQRPDLAAAERDLAAASADIGAAEAKRYPSVSLSGSIGLTAVSFGGLSSKGNTWSFGPRWWFNALLAAANSRCVTSKGLHNPRMRKQRHSPYASHNRSVARNMQTNFSPQLLAPLPVPPRKIYARIY